MNNVFFSRDYFKGMFYTVPIASMYGIFTYIYHKNQLNGGKYTIQGWYWVNIADSYSLTKRFKNEGNIIS